jgi:inorganic pyrophosphatase
MQKEMPAFTGDGAIYIIIETPKDSHYKYEYDAEFERMKLKSILPAGNVLLQDQGSP